MEQIISITHLGNPVYTNQNDERHNLYSDLEKKYISLVIPSFFNYASKLIAAHNKTEDNRSTPAEVAKAKKDVKYYLFQLSAFTPDKYQAWQFNAEDQKQVSKENPNY